MRFEGTKAYVATDDLKIAVNAAITLERPLLVKGEPGTGKTVLALEIAKAHRRAADRMAHQIHDQSAAGPLRIRRGLAPARQPARRRARQGHPQLHQARQAVGRLRRRRAPGVADRRDRQGRHRVSQRPVAGTRPHGVLCLRDRRDREGAAPADRGHHLEQREGIAGRFFAPMLLSLHPVSRRRHHARDHRGALPRHQTKAGREKP